MIPYEVVVPAGPEGERVDGIAIATAFVNGAMHVGVIVDKHLYWYQSIEVEWGAPMPIDVKAL